MRCPWCGIENAVNAETCASCGAILSSGKGSAQVRYDQFPPSDRPVPSQLYSQTPPSQFSKKRSRIPEILVAVAAVLFIALLIALPTIAPLNRPDSAATYTDLAGTWRTELPVPFNVRTNSGPTGTLENSGTEIREMTFRIALTDDPGVVLVSMSYEVVSSDIWNSTGYIAEQSPDVFAATVNGTAISFNQGSVAAFFTFTKTEMTGFWDYSPTNGSFMQDVSNYYFELTLKKQ